MLGEHVEKFLEIPITHSVVTAMWEYHPGQTARASQANPAPPRPEQRKTTHEVPPGGASPRDAQECTREAGRLGMEGQGSPGGRRGQTRPGPSQGCTVTGTFIVVSVARSLVLSTPKPA